MSASKNSPPDSTSWVPPVTDVAYALPADDTNWLPPLPRPALITLPPNSTISLPPL